MAFKKGEQNGTPFEKGKVANPKGRPKGVQSFSELLKKRLDGEKIIEIEGELAGIVDKPFAKQAKVGDKVKLRYSITNREQIVEHLLAIASNEKVPGLQLPAIKEIIDRTDGKAEQKTKVEHEHTGDININIEGRISLDTDVKNHLSRMTKAIPVNLLVLAMVAAKRQISPIFIMSQLASSYYAKFSGFGNYQARKTDEPFDISGVQYDWNAITKLYDDDPNMGIEEAIVIPEPSIKESEAKKKLLEMLNIKQK